ncbi:hypothetical protein Taro_038183 [Colocasia esculenta]|uniref:Oberon PHD finger domain-containing protein n=1 Tax=Colocasia esculenta TaxID=4460 RepID=A0A843WMY7_COLES|nr:hypothetical protein [Colocasia esculenta]
MEDKASSRTGDASTPSSSAATGKLDRRGLIDRTEFVRVIIQCLYSLGYRNAAAALELDSDRLLQRGFLWHYILDAPLYSAPKAPRLPFSTQLSLRVFRQLSAALTISRSGSAIADLVIRVCFPCGMVLMDRADRAMDSTDKADRAVDPGCSGSNNYEPISIKEPLVPVPVSAGSSGEGLPYAPEDWPSPGDVWGWKVGRRVSSSGYWVDRCLRPPHRFLKDNGLGSKHGFYSRVLVEQFVRKQFPEADVKAFFDSFIWKIPSVNHSAKRKGIKKDGSAAAPVERLSHRKITFGSQFRKMSVESGGCKAGNKMCSSLSKTRSDPPAALECDICCSEAGFCHDCCCILCCQVVDWAYDGYNLIKCEGIVDKYFICGHIAHMDCALHAYMGGTVGGSIGLDVEYYCRRCDNKTDLIPHVSKILHTCQSLDSRDDIEKKLNLALRILHGSEQMKAKILLKRIQSMMAKLTCGVCLRDIWEEDDSVPVVSTETDLATGNGGSLLGAVDLTGYRGLGDTLYELESSVGEETIDGRSLDESYMNSDYGIIAIKLEDEVDQALQELRKSQESEYSLVEQKLYAQKDYLISLYQQLDAERTELAQQTTSQNKIVNSFLLGNVLSKLDQIKQEESKLREMLEISKGFGQASKHVVKEYFQLAIDD